ncbi:alkene reductase [Marinomonas mediterranea]|jgi:NADH:flavin oxidoreductases, Old Yellow Enzyme family|uniref:12-oxophytodienoate reductase n=1 Tax=Marinomonas mediterranea (strain ATCC 700492 / JCM 21426 / NBRC 103028 / MMB-1) TaxID=717774 RepID=F2JY59_MARM1|nr:alkene reductase [Marinomonas mediterranea]ADZ90795.1 12-oxophytodienoate reductase [Marinomonas mediterranea MMB-1]WCN16950.1 alkene reductase [Marinomonas mediterranea MMB-1]
MSLNADLFRSVELGDIALANRFVMAPLTRCRATNHLPNELMAEYYGQRASAGLLISECSIVTEGASAFGNDPGVYSQEQVEGWKKTTQAVHQAGGRIFMQIWHAGRAAHPSFNGGQDAVAPSAIAIDGETHTPEGKQPYSQPKALSRDEIKALVEDFRQAAVNAIEAGFDGVEIHAANGYLIDQFLRDGSNKRTDDYGGSVENRARFLVEVVEAVTNAIGSAKVGIRLSPLNSFNDMKDSDPVALTEYLSTRLNDFNLAYLHLMRADFFGVQQADVVSVARAHYKGHLMLNMGYQSEEANQVLASGQADSIAFGTGFLANPDFVERIKVGAELNTPNEATFYSPGAEGYTDYPLMSKN